MRLSLRRHQATPVAQGTGWVPAFAGMTEGDVGDSKLSIVFYDSLLRWDDRSLGSLDSSLRRDERQTSQRMIAGCNDHPAGGDDDVGRTEGQVVAIGEVEA